MQNEDAAPAAKGRPWKKYLVAFLLLDAVAGVILFADVGMLLRDTLEWIGSLGPLGPAAFIVIYVLACVFFVPGSLLSLGAGFLWGVVYGTAAVSAASTLGATAAFLVGRYLARGWVERRAAMNPKFHAVDEAVAREGWKIVGLMRLSPVFPFNLLNYLFGVTKVKLSHYVLASWVGMLPGTVLYVYLGSLAGDLARLGTGTAEAAGPGVWAMRAAGLAATVAVTLYVTRIAKSALSRKL